MCGSRYSVDDSLAPMVSRPADLSRSSASADVSSWLEVVEAARVLEHDAPGVGQHQLLGAAHVAVDQLLAQLGLQPLHRQRHRRLRAEQLLGGAREAALGDRRSRTPAARRAPWRRSYRTDKRYLWITRIIINLPQSRPARQIDAHGDAQTGLHLRHHAARRRAGPRLQHDRAPRRSAWRGKLAELGVDIMEAGFPIASDGRLRGGAAVSRAVPVKVAALARCTALDIERAAQALEKAKAPPRIHTFLATSDIHLKYKLKKTRAQVLEEAAKAVELARKYVDDVEFSAEDGGRTEVDYLIEVVARGRRRRRRHGQHPRHRRLLDPRGVRRADRPVAKALGSTAVVSVHCHDDLGPGGRELAGGGAERRAPGRVHGQRHRRARRQLLARGDRDGAARRAAIGSPFDDRHQDRASSIPASQLLTEIIGVGVQPNKAIVGAQRVRARGRHPPGRLPQGAHDVRDHRSEDGRRAREQAGARQAQRPARAARRAARSWASTLDKRAARRALHPVLGAGRPQEGDPRRRDPQAGASEVVEQRCCRVKLRKCGIL